MDTRVIAAIHDGDFERMFREIGWDHYTVIELPSDGPAHLARVGKTTFKWLAGYPDIHVHTHQTDDSASECLNEDITTLIGLLAALGTDGAKTEPTIGLYL